MTSEPNPVAAGGDIVGSIRNFIYSRFPLAADQQVKDEDDLLEGGIVDSLGILDVVGHLEQEFGIQVGDDDLNPENFGNINALMRFVEQKRA
ncbi:MAG: acyl carrier protein [Planctomycetota bacterium]